MPSQLLSIQPLHTWTPKTPMCECYSWILVGLNSPLSNWVLDFLSERPQNVWVGGKTSKTITLSTGAPQGCVISPLLFTLLTHDCVPSHSTNHIIKFADDMTVVGLINILFSSMWGRPKNLSSTSEEDLHSTPPSHQLCCSGKGEQHQVLRGAYL